MPFGSSPRKRGMDLTGRGQLIALSIPIDVKRSTLSVALPGGALPAGWPSRSGLLWSEVSSLEDSVPPVTGESRGLVLILPAARAHSIPSVSFWIRCSRDTQSRLSRGRAAHVSGLSPRHLPNKEQGGRRCVGKTGVEFPSLRKDVWDAWCQVCLVVPFPSGRCVQTDTQGRAQRSLLVPKCKCS